MNAQTKPSAGTAVAILEETRLPWHPAIGDRFGDIGVTQSEWKVITESVWPTAKSVDSVVMALAYCKAKKYDPFLKPVHIVPVWDSRANDGKGGYVDTVWPSISMMRMTAFRTGQYVGADEVEFGPVITKKFTGSVKAKGAWDEKTIEVSFPEWARQTVYRLQSGSRNKFVGPKVYWLETYARMGASELPNAMWQKRANGQVEKCCEAAALRKAFPEELGSEYAAEEMEGQRIIHADDEPVVPRKLEAPPPAENRPAEAIKGGSGPIKAPSPSGAAAPRRAPPPPQEIEDAEVVESDEARPSNPAGTMAKKALLLKLGTVKDAVGLISFQNTSMQAIIELSSEDREELIAAIQKKKAEVEAD